MGDAMKFHSAVLAAHAQFGGDLEDMQFKYDNYDASGPVITIPIRLAKRISDLLANAHHDSIVACLDVEIAKAEGAI